MLDTEIMNRSYIYNLLNYTKFLVLLIILAFSTSCEGDFLDKAPDEDMTLDDVFMERQYAERFLNGTYNYLPLEIDMVENIGRNPFVGASDEMEISWLGRYSHQMGAGSWGPVNVQDSHWRESYQAIRRLNIFTERIVETPMDESEKAVWVGEAEFLKAFFYFWMVRIYGPVPIVDQSMETEHDFSTIKRAPLADCIAYIVEKCDNAANLLPVNVQDRDIGKANRAAALALKARALLYFASPLWNGNPDYADFVDTDGVRLFPTADEGRWQIAADAAKVSIEEAEKAGYQLYQSPSNDPVKNYQEVFTVRNNKEILFARNSGVHSHQEMCAAPNGMGGWSGYCPTLQLVDAYEMQDGSKPILGYHPDGTPIINPTSSYQDEGYAAEDHPDGYYLAGVSNAYVNRDPRFYATINFNGAYWRGRQLEFWNSGVDGKSRGGAELYTVTGFLLKKYMDESVNIIQNQFVLKTWNYFRLGESYLNYAEALNEAQGPVTDVYHYVNAIRNRSGMPPLPSSLSKEEMREKIRHERRIELAFETHRYFDTRRWKIADQTDEDNFYGLNINVGTSLQDDSFYERVFLKSRVFDQNKHYLWPISQNEINKTPTIVQNPGWD